MRYQEIVAEAPVPQISKQQASDRRFFGPVYHGTNAEARAKIDKDGFKIAKDAWERANGYQSNDYAGGVPPPVHHLGFGVYFTTSKTIAKQFNGGSLRGLSEYYLDVPRLETINFGSPNTMMRWWVQNGYDFRRSPTTSNRDIERERHRATEALTENLKSRFDAVWFKGKGLRRLLDGDQICVYDPTRIYRIDASLATGVEIGAKVTHNQSALHYKGRNDVYLDAIHEPRFAGWRGYFRALDHAGNEQPRDTAHPIHYIPPPNMVGVIVAKRQTNPSFHDGRAEMFDIKWAKGGVQHNYYKDELTPIAPRRAR